MSTTTNEQFQQRTCTLRNLAEPTLRETRWRPPSLIRVTRLLPVHPRRLLRIRLRLCRSRPQHPLLLLRLLVGLRRSRRVVHLLVVLLRHHRPRLPANHHHHDPTHHKRQAETPETQAGQPQQKQHHQAARKQSRRTHRVILAKRAPRSPSADRPTHPRAPDPVQITMENGRPDSQARSLQGPHEGYRLRCCPPGPDTLCLRVTPEPGAAPR